MKKKLKKWWNAFTELKLWVQAIIVMVAIILIHNYILHQELVMPAHYGKMKKTKKAKSKKKKKK